MLIPAGYDIGFATGQGAPIWQTNSSRDAATDYWGRQVDFVTVS